MKTFTCATCKNEWPENYCPVCAHTIDRATIQQAFSSTPPLLAKSNIAAADVEVSRGHSAARPSKSDCPICGTVNTGKATGQFKAVGFQAFPNQCCFVCDAVWRPACPKWGALVCMICGCAAWLLVSVMFPGAFGTVFLSAILGVVPILYGLAVLAGMGGKMRILSKGRTAMEQAGRIRSK